MGIFKLMTVMVFCVASLYAQVQQLPSQTSQTNSQAQIDAKIKDYYAVVYGIVDGEELYNRLNRIISNNHHHRGYGELYTYLAKVFEDIDKNIIDFYSSNPNGQNPYNYDRGDRCGTYKQEGDCFNREHIFPQGIFGKRMPMKSDYHHIIPTDGYVNNRRSRFPFGEVGSVSWSSMNGSKLGRSKTVGYTGKVFEPIDEFKGDIARALFYFAVRYGKQGKNWQDPTLNNTNYKFYKSWYVSMLKEWHEADPVDEFERKRNQKGFEFQKNRNPFIDHPEWVDLIW